MTMVLLGFLLVLGAQTGDPGFGGGDDEPAVEAGDDVDAAAAAAAPRATDFVVPANAVPSTTLPSFPTPEPPPPKKKTKMELELEKARIDPALFPLVGLRVDVARLEMELVDFEGRGLTAARDTEVKLARARALLADAERIALHRMNVCLARRGIRSEVKNYRMTAGGPVRLTTPEMLGQASIVDVEGCARIELLDQALVDRLRRAHDVRTTLDTVNFPYHRIAERRALEEELRKLEKELAREDLPVLSAPGAKDF